MAAVKKNIILEDQKKGQKLYPFQHYITTQSIPIYLFIYSDICGKLFLTKSCQYMVITEEDMLAK